MREVGIKCIFYIRNASIYFVASRGRTLCNCVLWLAEANNSFTARWNSEVPGFLQLIVLASCTSFCSLCTTSRAAHCSFRQTKTLYSTSFKAMVIEGAFLNSGNFTSKTFNAGLTTKLNSQKSIVYEVSRSRNQWILSPSSNSGVQQNRRRQQPPSSWCSWYLLPSQYVVFVLQRTHVSSPNYNHVNSQRRTHSCFHSQCANGDEGNELHMCSKCPVIYISNH